MLAPAPQDRPASAAECEALLAPFGRPTTPTFATAPAVAPLPANPPVEIPTAEPATAADPGHFPGAEEWAPAAGGSFAGGHSGAFSTQQVAQTGPRPREFTAADKKKTRRWLILGACLHTTAVVLLLAWLLGAFNRKAEPAPVQQPTKRDPDKPKKKAKPGAFDSSSLTWPTGFGPDS